MSRKTDRTVRRDALRAQRLISAASFAPPSFFSIPPPRFANFKFVDHESCRWGVGARLSDSKEPQRLLKRPEVETGAARSFTRVINGGGVEIPATRYATATSPTRRFDGSSCPCLLRVPLALSCTSCSTALLHRCVPSL